MCDNAESTVTNTRVILQNPENMVPNIEGVIEGEGVKYVRAGAVTYAINCQPVTVIFRQMPYCTQGQSATNPATANFSPPSNLYLQLLP